MWKTLKEYIIITARRPDLIIINKKKKKKKENLQNCRLGWPQNKTEKCEKKDKYLDLDRELKKTMEHAGDNYTNCNWCVWNSN